MGTAEDLGIPRCYLTSAAIREPGLHAIDGFPPAAEVAGPRLWEEVGGVSGPSVAAPANVTEILRSGQGRWERNDGFPERVCFGLF